MNRSFLAPLDMDLVVDNVPIEVCKNVFLGSIHSAFNLDKLLEIGITHVLNSSRLPSSFPKSFIYLTIDVRDKENSNILACIPSSNIFIEAGTGTNGRFYVFLCNF